MNHLIPGLIAAVLAVGIIITLTISAVIRINHMDRNKIHEVRELYRKRNRV
ncbi:hypothetical protein [Spirochaeta isovalerica]|uniref:Uncharacterized protein n=1 Tax=Spirochaeta isovalerica TaxID=150 RepID=A0A841R7K2_9SPIO|nr:hypothetical protein [Spirochaeta isovalerica]MBB6479835.1 hypothetical protein [Spirochaeta isovalerica]